MTTTPQHPDRWPTDEFVSTERLIRPHGIAPITSVTDLAAQIDPFESDKEYDLFPADFYVSRRADIA